MTATEAMDAFDRLRGAGYREPADAQPGAVFGEFFESLRHLPADQVHEGLTRLIRSKRDTFWPAMGLILEHVTPSSSQGRSTRACGTCHGTLWVDAQPWKSNGIVYTGVQRCPDCGVPAPKGPETPHRSPVSASEARAALRTPTGPIAVPESLGAFLAGLRARLAP